MQKEERIQIARETVEICRTGKYEARPGGAVSIAEAVAQAVRGTFLYGDGRWPAPPASPLVPKNTRIEVRNETTFAAISRLASVGGHIGCLNFASARNPGGGFLTGAQAQEESLARSSALYPCLLAAPQYYDRNRANRSCLYLDLIIYSPQVPFIRNDAGTLLSKPILASVITAPAPNAGAVAQNERQNLPQVVPTLRRRSEQVLAVAAGQGVEHLVLGAWGCGVFRNEPSTVAGIFAQLLQPGGPYANAFHSVVFGVYDRSPGEPIYQAFNRVLAPLAQRAAN